MSVVSSFGDLSIIFNAPVDLLPLSDINPKTLHLLLLVAGKRDDEPDFNPAHLEFTWEAVEMTPYKIQLRLNFSYPLEISPLAEQDKVAVRFMKPSMWYSK